MISLIKIPESWQGSFDDWWLRARWSSTIAVLCAVMQFAPKWHGAFGNIWILPLKILAMVVTFGAIASPLAWIYLLIFLVPLAVLIMTGELLHAAIYWSLRIYFKTLTNGQLIGLSMIGGTGLTATGLFWLAHIFP